MRIKKDVLDKFYTNRDVAKDLVFKIDLNQFNLIIEPSAGNGSFSDQIPGCLAMDINPGSEKIIQQDFLKYVYQGEIETAKILIIGNPPFGRQNSLAIKFIIKSCSIADTVAFILPKSFKKQSVQDKVPLYFHIDLQVDLADHSFLLDEKPYNVPCVFQVWKKTDHPRQKTTLIAPINFIYCKQDKADLSIRRVGVYAGRAYADIDKSTQSHYFIKLNNINNLNNIIDSINGVVWQHDNTVGPRSISKNELNKELNKII